MQEGNKTVMWIVSIVVLVLIVGIGALLLTRNSTNQTENTDSAEAESQIPAEASFVLSEQNASDQNGTVVFEEVDDQVRVTISLSKAYPEAQPAHIHEGNCPTPGGIQFPLEDVVSGSSVTMLDTSLSELASMGDLAVNIHKSADESSTYYACGDLDF